MRGYFATWTLKTRIIKNAGIAQWDSVLERIVYHRVFKSAAFFKILTCKETLSFPPLQPACNWHLAMGRWWGWLMQIECAHCVASVGPLCCETLRQIQSNFSGRAIAAVVTAWRASRRFSSGWSFRTLRLAPSFLIYWICYALWRIHYI